MDAPNLPGIQLTVPKQIFAAMKHLTADKGRHSNISFVVRNDHWIAVGTNGQVAGMIRVLAEGLEPCSFSGKFNAVSGLEPNEDGCYILKIHTEQALFPMPWAEIIGAYGSLMVTVESASPAVSALFSMNTDKSLFPVTSSVDCLERMIKAVKAYNKEATIQFQPINSGKAIRVILKDDSSFYGVMVATEMLNYKAPSWVISQQGLLDSDEENGGEQ